MCLIVWASRLLGGYYLPLRPCGSSICKAITQPLLNHTRIAQCQAYDLRIVAPPEQLQLSRAELETEIGGELLCRFPRHTEGRSLLWSSVEGSFVPDASAEAADAAAVLLHLESQVHRREARREEGGPESRAGAEETSVVIGTHSASDALPSDPAPARLAAGTHALRAAAPLDAAAEAALPPPRVERGVHTGHRRPRNQAVQTVENAILTATGHCAARCTRPTSGPGAAAQGARGVQAPRPGPGSKAPAPATGAKAPPKGPLAALLESVQDAADASTTASASQPVAQGADRAAHPFLARETAVLERILTQNASVETVMDFKYWDDPSDAARPQEGSLLPLWSFAAAAAGPQMVTALAWCPGEPDVFAVGHGSFDPAKRQTGTLAVHSLRAPSRPQLVCPLPTSVLCLAFHPVFADMLAVGCQDGVVRVLQLRGHLGGSDRPPPLYTARPEAAGHREPVWQVSVCQGDYIHALLAH